MKERKPLYDKKISGKFYVERKPREIAELLVKICEENDDRVGQAIFNALWFWYKEHKPHDTFSIEDKEFLDILKAYHRGSRKGSREVRKMMK